MKYDHNLGIEVSFFIRIQLITFYFLIHAFSSQTGLLISISISGIVYWPCLKGCQFYVPCMKIYPVQKSTDNIL